MAETAGASLTLENQREACAYRILRYTPNLVRNEWVNIGVLVYHPASGERRLRLLEDPGEFARVRRLHPHADEALLRALRDDIERQFAASAGDWRDLLAKWDNTLSNALQLAPQKGVLSGDLGAELERLYADQFTFPGDPMRLDYGYRRNGTHGFVQALSVTRAPADAKLLAYTAGRIRAQTASAEFGAVTNVALSADNKRHRFVRDTLRDACVDPVPLEGFAVWVARLKPMIQ